ncbi:MAG: chromate transporter [Muribaculaceae bacterium]|nr:chromate transporter [Muribaculaceae bacterium]
MSINSDASESSSASPRKNRGEVLQLFLSFFKIGLFTFGGGWAMISIIEREIVDKFHWIERDDFLDLLAVAQSLPGILAVNIATAVGDKLHGMKGSAMATLGCILPSFLIILAIAIFLTPDMIKNNHTLSAIFMGIRPAVVALIVAPVITSAKAAKLGLKTVWIPLLVALMISSSQLFGINLGFGSNPILFIILGGIGGWAFWKFSVRNLKKSQK